MWISTHIIPIFSAQGDNEVGTCPDTKVKMGESQH